jgi:DNA-binding response OmpR family regulator
MNAKVLLVDDSSTALLMGETVFRKYTSYEVLTAYDGEQGVQKALAEKPDLILLDVVMPRMDGFTACREIRKQPGLESVPIIMVTSRGEPANVELGYQSGCSAYLTKPINPHELLDMVRLFLGADDGVAQPGGPATTEESRLE